MNTRCPPKRVPSAARFFTLCRLTVQPPQSYSVGGQRSSGQLTGKPVGTPPDYRGRWCAIENRIDVFSHKLVCKELKLEFGTVCGNEIFQFFRFRGDDPDHWTMREEGPQQISSTF
ncbi:UNVERIFIED_CONTAM: hypothetical protein FKN15_030996 [Acipenser sinensis]